MDNGPPRRSGPAKEEEITLGAPSGNGCVGRHELPPLPYDYDALEPYISERTVRLHHSVHHRAYVDGLNAAEEALAQARRERRWDTVNDLLRRLAFHGSGHFLHTIYWTNMHPEGGGRPTDEELMRQIQRDFGSFEAFRDQFTAAANALPGNGWVLLVWQPEAGKLEILQTEQHHLSAQWTAVPILALDLWEHAYYLQYQARRPDYVESWWNVVNWPDVAQRLRRARRERNAREEATDCAEGSDWEEDGDGSDWPDGSDSETGDGSYGDVGDKPGGDPDAGGPDAPPPDGYGDGGRHEAGVGTAGGTDAGSGTGMNGGDGARRGSLRVASEPQARSSQDEIAAVQTVYGSRASVRRALWAGAVKGGTTTRTGTVRPTSGRRFLP